MCVTDSLCVCKCVFFRWNVYANTFNSRFWCDFQFSVYCMGVCVKNKEATIRQWKRCHDIHRWHGNKAKELPKSSIYLNLMTRKTHENTWWTIITLINICEGRDLSLMSLTEKRCLAIFGKWRTTSKGLCFSLAQIPNTLYVYV